jgi:leucyl aminopeptidase
MNFELGDADLQEAGRKACDALIILVPADFRAAKSPLDALIAQSVKSSDFDLRPGTVLSLYRPSQCKASRLALAGAGEGTAAQIRAAVQGAITQVKSKRLKKLTLCFAGPVSETALRAAVLAVSDTTYVYTETKTKPEIRTLESCLLLAANAQTHASPFSRVSASVAGMELARDWANRPANHATPTMLGRAAQALAKLPGVSCEVLGPRQVAKLGMGALEAVAQGSAEPLRFIVLRYSGAAKSAAPTVLVGKGITFDSGGISLKPSAEMDEMKYDMSGAASVLGTFLALSLLRPAINVVGLIAASENLPDGRAVKPGDVISSMSGQTIEILNTDAEGRLVLCDALTYAERFKPNAVVDIATLTGACVVALGGVRSGLFSSDDSLRDELMSAGDCALDLAWNMPLDDEYAEGLKSNFADVANIAGKGAGAVTAAKFLQRFAGKFAWAHLDIAGTAWRSGAHKGATGRPVGLLVEFLMNRAAVR